MKKLSGVILSNAIASIAVFATASTGSGRGKAYHDMTPAELREEGFIAKVYKETEKGFRIGIKIKHELVSLIGSVEVDGETVPVDFGKSVFIPKSAAESLDVAIAELNKIVATGAFDTEYDAATERLRAHAIRNKKPAKVQEIETAE